MPEEKPNRKFNAQERLQFRLIMMQEAHYQKESQMHRLAALYLEEAMQSVIWKEDALARLALILNCTPREFVHPDAVRMERALSVWG